VEGNRAGLPLGPVGDPESFDVSESVDAFNRQHLAPEFEFQSLLFGRVFRGFDGVREWVSELRETWGSYDLEPGEFIDLGAHVAVVSRLVASGACERRPGGPTASRASARSR
jgi:hypothetical protein